MRASAFSDKPELGRYPFFSKSVDATACHVRCAFSGPQLGQPRASQIPQLFEIWPSSFDLARNSRAQKKPAEDPEPACMNMPSPRGQRLPGAGSCNPRVFTRNVDPGPVRPGPASADCPRPSGPAAPHAVERKRAGPATTLSGALLSRWPAARSANFPPPCGLNHNEARGCVGGACRLGPAAVKASGPERSLPGRGPPGHY